MVDSDRTRLYHAMSHLTTCRKSLEDNAESVKAAIRDSVAKQVEAMRRREQWLVQQVELVQADQADQLRRQERCLQKTLTAQQQTLQLPLMPAEPPLISFTAESAAMHEAVGQYGRIVCGYAQSPSTFSSATPSLPGPVEEYDDEVKEDEAWEHKSLSSAEPFMVRMLPRSPPKLMVSASSAAANAVASLADSFEVLSAGSLDEDKTRWLINYVCKANEPCPTKSDCLCDGGCFRKPASSSTITASAATDEEKEAEAKIKQELGGNEYDRWLASCYQQQQQQQPSVMAPFAAFAATKPFLAGGSQQVLPQQQLQQQQQRHQLLDNWKILARGDWLSNSSK